MSLPGSSRVPHVGWFWISQDRCVFHEGQREKNSNNDHLLCRKGGGGNVLPEKKYSRVGMVHTQRDPRQIHRHHTNTLKRSGMCRSTSSTHTHTQKSGGIFNGVKSATQCSQKREWGPTHQIEAGVDNEMGKPVHELPSAVGVLEMLCIHLPLSDNPQLQTEQDNCQTQTPRKKH